MRGEVFELPRPRGTVGHEQDGHRYAIVVQSDDLTMLSTWLVCPTSASAPARSWRPQISIQGRKTRVLVEQLTAVDPRRLGALVGFMPLADMQEIDRALKLVLGLR